MCYAKGLKEQFESKKGYCADEKISSKTTWFGPKAAVSEAG